jgi:hypothetical protein
MEPTDEEAAGMTEASPEDVADQRQEVVDEVGDWPEPPMDADPADVAEQHEAVDIDDEQ